MADSWGKTGADGAGWPAEPPVVPPLSRPPDLPAGTAVPDPWPEPESTPIPDGSLTPSGRAALVGGLVGSTIAVVITAVMFLLVGLGNSDSNVTNLPQRSSLALAGPELDVQAILERVQASVVTIETGQEIAGGVYGGAGSGLIIDSDGLALTNDHVIAGATSIQVTLASGTTRRAHLVGSSPSTDIALIQIEGDGPFLPATLGSSAALQVGDEVLAIGNALNLGSTPTVTRGIVSAVGRQIATPGLELHELIQTDAAINPGNSGGPLVNAQGEVVGINTAIIENAQSVGFAIAIDAVKPQVEGLRSSGEKAAYLGVYTQSPASSEGATIVSIVPGSPAAVAGLRVDDVVVSVEGHAVTSPEALTTAVSDHAPGDRITIGYERGGDRGQVVATLGHR